MIIWRRLFERLFREKEGLADCLDVFTQYVQKSGECDQDTEIGKYTENVWCYLEWRINGEESARRWTGEQEVQDETEIIGLCCGFSGE